MNKYRNIYMVGIKGFGMASLAYLLQKMGKLITGSDVDEHFPTDEILRRASIQPLIGFKPENIPGNTDLVITTGAHGGLHNSEVLEAEKRGITVMTHAEALGRVMDMFENKIAVCGTHGKTTTSAMLAFILWKLGKPIGYQVGAPSFSGLQGGDFSGTEYFVVESDEYVASPGIDNTPRFMFQNPDYILCTGIDYDHVDVYESLETVKNAFYEFFMKNRVRPYISFCYDDEDTRQVVLKTDLPALSYGTSIDADAYISNIRVENGKTLFDLKIRDQTFKSFSLAIPGDHNVRNAVGVLTILEALNTDLDEVRPILAQFTGSKRRFERLLENDSYLLIDDYAHHPHELEALIQGTKALFPERRLVLLFQPHMYSRTQTFKDEFIAALKKADLTYILDIFTSARETAGGFLITAERLAAEAQSSSVQYVTSNTVITTLASHIQPHDVIITAGAGDIYKLHPAIIELLQSRS